MKNKRAIFALLLFPLYTVLLSGCELKTDDVNIMCELTIEASLPNPDCKLVDLKDLVLETTNLNTKEVIKQKVTEFPFTITLQKGYYQRIYMDSQSVTEENTVTGEKRVRWIRGSKSDLYLLQDKQKGQLTFFYMR